MSGTPRSEARLEVVAGEDAEAAGVLRQRGGDAELGREVGDRARRVGAERLEPARLATGSARSSSRSRSAHSTYPSSPASSSSLAGSTSPRNAIGVAPGAAPQLGVDVLEQALASARATTSGGCRRAPRARTSEPGSDGTDGELADRLHALHPKSPSCRMCERDGSSGARALERRGGAWHTERRASGGSRRASGSRRAAIPRYGRNVTTRRSARRPHPGDAGHARPARRPLAAEGLRRRGRAVPRDGLPRGSRPGRRDARAHEPVGRRCATSGCRRWRRAPTGGRPRCCSTSRASGTGTSRASTTRSPPGGTTPH